jgi:hypothetical protein
VQVGCTINYARTGLWKQTEESARVDYPGDVGENELSTSRDPDSSGLRFVVFNRGPVAQLGARFHGMEEVVGSIPTRSTNLLTELNNIKAGEFVFSRRRSGYARAALFSRHTTGNNAPHSRQDGFEHAVIAPHDRHILCDP